jgi:hypothetical protein
MNPRGRISIGESPWGIIEGRIANMGLANDSLVHHDDILVEGKASCYCRKRSA